MEALREASQALQSDPNYAIEALSHLQAKSGIDFSTDPNLSNLSHLLSNLKSLLLKLEKFQGYGLHSLLHRRITTYRISRVTCAIQSEIRAYLDRKSIEALVQTLTESSADEEDKVKILVEFIDRLSEGFNIDFQELVLRAKVFSILEFIFCDSNCSIRVREQAAQCIVALVRFNRNVFVGLVLMGPTIGALISMASSCSIQVLTTLIKLIRSPLVDEIESKCEIPKIVSLLCSQDLAVQVVALDCVLELAYIGRKEVIEAMLREDLIKKLIHLQRVVEDGNSLVEMGFNDEGESSGSVKRNMGIEGRGDREDFPFSGCVSRFAIQLEVGEGLSAQEKTEFKLEILRIVREVCDSDAEIATITAEVLWGSSP